MTHRTYKIDVRVVEIRTFTVTVPRKPGHDDLEEASARPRPWLWLRVATRGTSAL